MKILYIILGSLFLILGVLGIFVPVLPTTPFLLLTASLYLKSSPQLYGWLMTNRRLGPYVYNYRNKKAITLTTKVVSLTLMWVTMLICIFVIIDLLWVQVMLGVVLISVTVHILRFRTMTKEEVVKMIPVRSQAAISTLSAIANDIWHEHYADILSVEQIDYMTEKFQSPDAISEQINSEGYKYYTINASGVNVGYAGVKPDNGKMLLSKLYIYKEWRSKGYARETITFIENLCRRYSTPTLRLTVNRNNTSAIETYKHLGFSVSEERVTDIGNGFVMDDYIMEKIIK